MATKMRCEKEYSATSVRLIGYLLPLTLLLGACTTAQDVWQGDDVVIDARQEVLEEEVESISDQNQELLDKFDALERLYIALAARVDAQEALLKNANGTLSSADFEALRGLVERSRTQLSAVTSNVETIESRLYTVEIATAVGNHELAAPQPVTSNEASSDNIEEETLEPSEPTVEQPAILTTDAGNEYGIHLASFRSNEQVSGAWNNLVSTFSELEQTTPLISSQSQEGIGDFLRLIAGPYDSSQQAEAACDRIKSVSDEQYCRVADYVGDGIAD